MKKKIICIFCLLTAFVFSASVVQAQDYAYTDNGDGTCTITGYTGPGGTVTIPDTINGLSVTSIGWSAFYYCTSLTSVTIPASVTSIGVYVFAGCSSLTTITVNPSNSAYSSVAGVLFDKSQTTLIECPGGKAGTYTIPNSVTSIGQGAFFECSSLTSVTIPNSVTSIGVQAFMMNSTKYTSLTSVTIPNSVTSIGYEAFRDCTSLTSVYFQGNAPSADSSVFSGDNNATVYYLPGATGWPTVPDTWAGRPTALWLFPDFLYMYNNGTITITGYTGSGGDVTIPDTINGLPVTSIGDWAFRNCTSLTNVTIPDSVISIGDYLFFNCTSLTSVTIPNSVTSIGNFAFYYCPSLTAITVDTNNPAYSSVAGVLFDKSQTTLIECPGGKAGSYTVPNSVTNIGTYSFAYCTSLTSLTISNGVTSIAQDAFDFCNHLTSATIGNSVISIGNEVFYGCSSLTAITVDPNNPAYSSVAGVLFNKSQTTLIECPGGKAGSYEIPNSVTNIGYNAFGNCGLTSVTIPNSVTSIGFEAFFDCYGLTSVTIPNSVTSIGGDAFAYCYSLTGVYFQGNAPSGGSDSSVFYNDNAIVYYLPWTTGWGTTFGGRPTALWIRPMTVDLNHDGIPNFYDFSVFATFWQNISCSEPNWCNGSDFDKNGIVDIYDLQIFAELWLWPVADVDMDRAVNFTDYAIFADNWMDDTCCDPNWCGGTDFDHSGSVDMLDLAIFAGYWLEGI